MKEKRCINCMKLMPDMERVCPHCGFIEEYVEDSYKSSQSHYLPIRHSLDNGRYQVGRMIGEGGFGIVYIGWDDKFGQVVAIKEFYSRQFVESREMSVRINPYKDTEEKYRQEIERVKKEARAIKQFTECPGIVRVEDYFEENNTVYLVMAYVEGITLAQYMKKNEGGIDGARCLEKFRPIIESLFQIHKMGMLHRDISLDNIMVQKDNSLKLMDFGAARPMDAKTSSVTVKYGYGPREQYNVSSDNQGPWLDVYALCVCLWNCVTGKTMLDSGERAEGEDVWKESKVSGLTREQKETIRKGLELDYKKRLRSMNELYHGLYGKWLEETKIEPGSDSGLGEKPAVGNKLKKLIGKLTARPKKLAVIAAAVIILGGGAVWGIWYWNNGTDADTASGTETQTDTGSDENAENQWTDVEGNIYTCERSNGLANGIGTCEYINGGHYEGEFVEGRREGTGTYWFAGDDNYNRQKYSGEWKDGERNGTGTLYWINGDRYEGDWADDTMEGTGTYWYAKDDDSGRQKYEGEWEDGERNGMGTLYWTNGARYEGEFLNDSRNGTGIYWYPKDNENGKEKYDGEWKEGECSGKGIVTYREDSERLQFVGQFADGLWNGEGVLYYKDGRRTEGTWVDNELEGMAVRWYSKEDDTGRLKYVGEFKNSVRDGVGTLYWKDGSYWEGEWKEDNRKGQGILWFDEEDTRLKYTGTWDGDNNDGAGVLYYKDGTVKTGIWKNHELQGVAAEEETWEDNGNTYTGCQINGMLQGIGRVESADGTISEGEFLNGHLHGSGCTVIYSGEYDGYRYEGECLYLGEKSYDDGTHFFPDGDKYVGKLENSMYNGFGIYYGDGYMQMGYWKDGEYQMDPDWETWEDDSGAIYAGIYTDGVIDGEGIALYPDGARFEGEFDMGEWKKGTYYYAEGSEKLYGTGEYKDGKYNGNIVYVHADGNRYEGEVVMGRREGFGTMYYTDGTIESGIWKEDKFQGEARE